MKGLGRGLEESWFLLRQTIRSGKASRLYGRAIKLEKAGRDAEAFAFTKEALDSLPPIEGDRPAPPTTSLVLVLTVLYAHLAAKLGTPNVADDAIRRAIDLCAPNEDIPQVRQQLAWLRQRLSPIGRGPSESS